MEGELLIKEGMVMAYEADVGCWSPKEILGVAMVETCFLVTIEAGFVISFRELLD